jgi:hypothetical protein
MVGIVPQTVSRKKVQKAQNEMKEDFFIAFVLLVAELCLRLVRWRADKKRGR